LLRIAGALLVAGLGWWLFEHVFVTDEQRIQRLIASMAQAVEAGNLLKLEAGIAQDYSDDFGFDKSTILGVVRTFRADYDRVTISISEMQIVVEPDHRRAYAGFTGEIVARPKGSTADAEVRGDRYRLSFRKTDQGWQMTRAEIPESKLD
jgi:hypothetical protein